MPVAQVGNLRMHYQIKGEGPPLVMIMGLNGDITWWDRLLTELAGDFRLLLFDNRGAGLTDKPNEKYTISMLAEDTVGLMEEVGIQQAHVFGISMGGMIAQEMALAFPDHVNGLVLGCTHSGGEGLHAPAREAIQKLTDNRGKSLHEFAEQVMSVLFSPSFVEANPSIIRALVDHYVSTPPSGKGFSRQFLAVLGHNAFARLPLIRHHTLILTGDADALIPPENSDVLCSGIPDARLVRIPGAGHTFFIEAPKATAEHLRSHLLHS